jgi:hypothetical protein
MLEMDGIADVSDDLEILASSSPVVFHDVYTQEPTTRSW